ncbi:MAG: hypothetical protein ACU0DK_10010 [Pseudooceanicola sp.]
MTALALPAALSLLAIIAARFARNRVVYWVLRILGAVTFAGITLRAIALMNETPEGAFGNLGTSLALPGLTFGPFIVLLLVPLEIWTRKNAGKG